MRLLQFPYIQTINLKIFNHPFMSAYNFTFLSNRIICIKRKISFLCTHTSTYYIIFIQDFLFGVYTKFIIVKLFPSFNKIQFNVNCVFRNEIE